MKSVMALIVITGVMFVWGCSKPEEPKKETTGGQSTIGTAVTDHVITDAEVGKETKCSVMGDKVKVDKNTLAVEYKGKIYYFCCPDCPAKFKADPEKYADKTPEKPK